LVLTKSSPTPDSWYLFGYLSDRSIDNSIADATTLNSSIVACCSSRDSAPNCVGVLSLGNARADDGRTDILIGIVALREAIGIVVFEAIV
jgi:hypothetical protein